MKILFFSCFLIASCMVSAKQTYPNLMFPEEGATPASASLDVVDWLQGHWRGEAFGGIVEEVWAPPLGGSMMGAFKLVVNGKVQFYEIETIAEEQGSLIFRLKHFNRDLSGWEEKDQSVDFQLVKVTDHKVYFDGLTLERISDTAINIYVAIEADGQVSEEKFAYTRVE